MPPAPDPVTRTLVRARLAEGQAVPLGRFRIRRLTNVRRRPGLPSLVGMVALVLVLVELSSFFQARAAQFGLGLALGGAIGNMTSARRDGGVLDFVDLGFWPVFNVADAGIVLGVGMALWWLR
jgi:signal peptidase II